MISIKNGRIYFGVLFAILTLCFLSGTAAAQTPRRSPKPLATPPPRVLTGAEIISQSTEEEPAEPIAEPVRTPSPEEIRQPVKRSKKEKGTYDERQKRMMMNLDILTRAEQRSDGLRKQLFEMIEKETTVKSRLDQIESEIRPEVIDRSLVLAGSLHPEVIRESRKKSLEGERANLQVLLTEIQTTRANLNINLVKSDQMVERLRVKVERDIDDSFLNEDEPE